MANIKKKSQSRIRTVLRRLRRITKNNWKNWSKNAVVFLLKYVIIALIVGTGVTFFFHKLATKQLNTLTEKSTKEIVEALCPNDFSLLIDEKDYSPGSTCEIESKTKEIKPYFAVRNNSKYPAKDVTVYVYLDKNDIKEGMQALKKCFKANSGELRILEGEAIEDLEGRGFVIPSPIYPGKSRYIHSLELRMIKDTTKIIVWINGQHEFYLVYNINKDDEKKISEPS